MSRSSRHASFHLFVHLVVSSPGMVYKRWPQCLPACKHLDFAWSLDPVLVRVAMSAFVGKYADELIRTAKYIATPGKGILAADESTATGTIGKRLAVGNVENTEPNRRAFRELLFTAPGAAAFLSGAILYEETFYQAASDGTPFAAALAAAGVVPGIKADTGLVAINAGGAGDGEETATEGLDGLGARCARYYAGGARFAKWRAVLRIGGGGGAPSELAVKQNAEGLARYAAICQENGLVPILEPEILTDGDHDITTCAAVTERVLAAVYKSLNDHKVLLEGTLLKPSMVTPGSGSPKVGAEVIAEYTVAALRRTVPPAVPGIMFLSGGGQSDEEATRNLNAMNKLDVVKPWTLSFSFGRGLQKSAVIKWAGKEENVAAAQATFLARCKANAEATLGVYTGAGAGDATVS